MNILFVVGRLTGGGAERVCASLANGLSNLGHDVTILTSYRTDKDYMVYSNVCVRYLYDKQPLSRNIYEKIRNRLYYPLRYTIVLFRILSDHDIDVIINIMGFYMLNSILVAKLKRVKHIFSDHDACDSPKEYPMSNLDKRQKFYYSRFCDLTTVLTNRDKKLFGNRKDVVVAPNPLFLTLSENIPSKAKIILAIGRLDVWRVKGFDNLIIAWSKICNEFPDWKLRIVGDGGDKAKDFLSGIVNMNKARNVFFAPFCTNVVEEYKNAEVFVLSSRYEGFGLVLTEAMSQRCACVACDFLGRQQDIITDGIDGLLAKNDDPNHLALQIQKLIQNDELRHEIQNHSVDNLSRFSENNIAKLWDGFIKQSKQIEVKQ